MKLGFATIAAIPLAILLAFSSIAWAQDEREPVIFVHGLKGSADDFVDIRRALVGLEGRYRWIQYHYDDLHHSTRANGDRLAEALVALHSKKVTVVAHSMGGVLSKRALNRLTYEENPRINQFERIRLITIDTPWTGFRAPEDGTFSGFMAQFFALPFIPKGFHDMRAGSWFFQGRSNAPDPVDRWGVIEAPLPSQAEVVLFFARQGNAAYDYAEEPIRPLVAELPKWARSQQPHFEDLQQQNFFDILKQARGANEFRSELSLVPEGESDPPEAHTLELLEKYFPHFPGDHAGILHDSSPQSVIGAIRSELEK